MSGNIDAKLQCSKYWLVKSLMWQWATAKSFAEGENTKCYSNRVIISGLSHKCTRQAFRVKQLFRHGVNIEIRAYEI